MNLKTINFGGVTIASLKVQGVTGGFLAHGRTVQQAINAVFARYRYYSLNK